jgi:hypothetical protein
MMPVVYVAGPRQWNTLRDDSFAAVRVAALASTQGWAPVLPHLILTPLAEMLPHLPESYWLESALALLRRCDALVLCPGWHASRIVLAEVEEAKRAGISVWKAIGELPCGQYFLAQRAADGRHNLKPVI